MFKTFIYLIALVANLNNPSVSGDLDVEVTTRTISLKNRYGNEFVNNVFRDNILLTLKYMDGDIKNKSQINWEDVQKPDSFGFRLQPGETFAFHDHYSAEYTDSIKLTTNAHFNYADGFKSSGRLVGDGVCHLASLIYWAAKDAGLDAVSPVSHDFAVINEVPKEYGVSIYHMPGNTAIGASQNLYITNDFDSEVVFVFNYDGDVLSATVVKNKTKLAAGDL